MISDEHQREVVAVTSATWERLCGEDVFQRMFRGKERGHRIADFVEEQTVECLEREFEVQHEVKGEARRARGMGDAWLCSNDIFNPINVKAGVHGIGGQPNMVSLAKLTDALLEHWIDCYYLLLVKFTDTDPPTPDVQLVNILDYLDFLHFDSGTGQLMLKADRFARYLEDEGPSMRVGPAEAVARLVDIRRTGDARLAATRQKKLAALELKLERYDPSIEVDQRGLTFG